MKAPLRDRLRTGMCAAEPEGPDFRRVPRGPSHAGATFGTPPNAGVRQTRLLAHFEAEKHGFHWYRGPGTV